MRPNPAHYRSGERHESNRRTDCFSRQTLERVCIPVSDRASHRAGEIQRILREIPRALGCGEINMLWGIGVAAVVVIYVIVSKLDAMVNELKQIRFLLNESESEKYRRKQEEFRNP